MMSFPRRLAALFERYRLAHDTVAGRAFRLKDAHGQPLGRLERLERDAHQLRVAGAATVHRITLHDGPNTVSVTRPRGAAADAPLRFDLALARPAEDDGTGPHLSWQVSDGAAPRKADLRFPGALAVRLGHLGWFSWAMLRLIPTFVGWSRTRDPRHRGTVKRALGLDRAARFRPFVPSVLQGDHALPPSEAAQAITIVVPVYNGFALLEECLTRVARYTDLPWHLILVDDASPDPNVRPFLRDWANRPQGGRVELLELPRNLGFIGAVNAGLERAETGREPGSRRPVVLLNSDAFVPPDWASRLTAPLSDPAVASVTPMSNDAEITTVPVICARHDLVAGAGDRIDAIARNMDPAIARADMPTGVGFCMALSPRFLALVPRLDTAFGVGYGEEVDWCQKTAALGGRHLGLGTLFVEHRGGMSFGSDVKTRLVAQNGALISRRYPTYDLDVQRFISADPLSTPRLVLALAWAGTVRDRIPVYLAHDMGGGAEIWLQQRIDDDLEHGLPSVVLRVGGPARWQLELHAPGGVTGAMTDERADVETLLALLPARDLVYSCGVGDPDPVSLPDLLLTLRHPGDRVEVLLHDWLPISPSYTLLDADGIYRGPVTAGRTDPAHRTRRPNGAAVTLEQWQAAWGRLLHAADRIRVFSEDGRVQIRAVWPDLNDARLEIRGHPMPHLHRLAVPQERHTSGGAPVIGVLGNLNRQKGAAVVAALGRRLGTTGGGAKIVVLGQVDPECPMPRRVKVHGGYRVGDIPDLVQRYAISHWLVPAIWPETFSYATHEALATGLPVLAFDLGAQGMTVSKAPRGRVVPLEEGRDPVQAVLDCLAQ